MKPMREMAFAVALMVGLSGCAGSIQQWIVNTRVHQGEIALDRGDVRDAELAYRLALHVNPKDPRAQGGYVRAAAALAQAEYAKGDFDGALATIDDGLAVDPQSVRLAALKRSIDQARLKREIVISNYPSYREAGVALAHSYEQLNVTNKLLLRGLKRFSYTFDANDLTDAIKRSYELQLEIVKNGNHLILYRQLVTSGVPETASQSTTSNTTSLLPLP
ncbi:MAG: tetratricopeptide repeat protein [Candidatus Eremiobacteraeota bacterium]|nr:tetratricopeptide repeat protein [Candidatus Eremiobacteraeota bacterium]